MTWMKWLILGTVMMTLTACNGWTNDHDQRAEGGASQRAAGSDDAASTSSNGSTGKDAVANGESGFDAGGALPMPKQELTPDSGDTGQAVFAGGCFWCTEAVFEQLRGVRDVVSGYAGGSPDTANYRAVSGGETGHAEAIRIDYDPSQISFGQLMRIFFATHDPTQLNRQGPDVGPQYRSAVFYANDQQKQAAQAYIAQLENAGAFDDPIVTTLEPLEQFFEAEQYHQDYVQQNPTQPYIQFQAMPKLDKLRQKYGDQLK